MTDKFIIAATVKSGFWRCGVHWPHEGRPASRGDFSDTQWARLEGEKKLTVKPADDDELQAADERIVAIASAIGKLPDDAFQKDGKPRLENLNALLGPDFKAVTASERNLIWDRMQGQAADTEKSGAA